MLVQFYENDFLISFRPLVLYAFKLPVIVLSLLFYGFINFFLICKINF